MSIISSPAPGLFCSSLGSCGAVVQAGADLRVLGEFSNRPAKPLAGLKFREFFVWLSQSMARVSQSTPGTAIKLPATSGWDSI